MSDNTKDLGGLIEATRREAQAQQALVEERLREAAPRSRGKAMLCSLLGAVLAVVLFYQAPRFSQPYTWPDPAINPDAAEGDLLAVAGLVETYRISQGK